MNFDLIQAPGESERYSPYTQKPTPTLPRSYSLPPCALYLSFLSGMLITVDSIDCFRFGRRQDFQLQQLVAGQAKLPLIGDDVLCSVSAIGNRLATGRRHTANKRSGIHQRRTQGNIDFCSYDQRITFDHSTCSRRKKSDLGFASNLIDNRSLRRRRADLADRLPHCRGQTPRFQQSPHDIGSF